MLGLCLALIDSEEEKSKFITLYEEYRHLMFYVAQEILNDEHHSEDAVQEAFLRIAKNFGKVGEISSPQTRNFVVIITKNVALTMLKKENTFSSDDFIIENSTEFTDDVFEVISNKILAEYILKLSEIHRTVLYLYHVYGYNIKEIANLLSISVDSAKKRVQRARLRLKELLEKDGFLYE